MINRFALSCLCIELDRNVRFGVTLVYILLSVTVQETEYCITLYFRGKKISRKVNLKYFREKIFSRIYCSRENIFPRKYPPVKIFSRDFFFTANM